MTVEVKCCNDCPLYEFNMDTGYGTCNHPKSFDGGECYTDGKLIRDHKENARAEKSVYKSCPLKQEEMLIKYVG